MPLLDHTPVEGDTFGNRTITLVIEDHEGVHLCLDDGTIVTVEVM